MRRIDDARPCDRNRLDWWFTEEALDPPQSPPKPPLTLAQLPAARRTMVLEK